MKSKLLFIIFTLLFLISCKFNDDEIEIENDQTNSESAIGYTTINVIFNTEDSLPKKSVSVSIIGKDARQIFDSEGKTNYRVKNGELDLLLATGVNPTNENPVTFSLLAYMEGYPPLKQEVVVSNSNEKISINCIFKKPIVLNKEQKKTTTLIDKNKVDKKLISNSDVVYTKSKVQKPANTNELKKEIILVNKKQVKTEKNITASLPETEAQKPTITSKIKKEVILFEKKKFNFEKNVDATSPITEVQKPTIIPKIKKDIILVEKKPVNTQTNLSFSSTKNEILIPTITPNIKKEVILDEKKSIKVEKNVIANLSKIDAQQSTITELNKDLITEKIENIKTDSLRVIAKSNVKSPKIDARKLIITELKKDSVNKNKRRSIFKTLNSKIKNDTSKIEKQNDNLNLTKKDSIKFERKNLAVSIGVGFPLYSLSLNYQFSNKIGARLGFLTGFYEPYYYTSFKANYTEVKGNFQVNMINLFLDYFPRDKSIFRFTFGIAKSFNDYSFSVTPLTNQSFGYIAYTPADIGKIKTKVLVNSFMPYLGIGLGRAIPTYRLGLGLDLGLYYQGSPKFKFQSEGSFIPSDTEKNTDLFNNTFSDWVFLPSINFQIKYKILPR